MCGQPHSVTITCCVLHYSPFSFILFEKIKDHFQKYKYDFFRDFLYNIFTHKELITSLVAMDSFTYVNTFRLPIPAPASLLGARWPANMGAPARMAGPCCMTA